MKNSSILLVAAISVLSSTAALACFSRDAKPMSIRAVEKLSEMNETFNTCVQKIQDVGVDLKSSAAYRKNIQSNDLTSIAYTVMIQGANNQGKQTRIYISYDLAEKAFVCTEPTNFIPKCF